MTPAALPPDTASRSQASSTGGAPNLFWVKTAAAVTGLPSSVASRPCRGGLPLDPGMAAGGDEALGGGDAHGQTPMLDRPALSSRPSIRLAHWIIWPAAPLPRLSSAAMARTGPVRSS